MGNTPIYGWPYPELGVSADGPAGIGNLGRAAEITLNQIATDRVYFAQQKNHTAGVGISSIGGWTNAGGFVGNASGITVPVAGIYVIYLATVNLSRLTTRPDSNIQITAGGGCQAYIPTGQTNTSAVFMTLCTAGNQINLQFENKETVAFTALMLLNIAKVAA